jgi:hypothetical protein
MQDAQVTPVDWLQRLHPNIMRENLSVFNDFLKNLDIDEENPDDKDDDEEE